MFLSKVKDQKVELLRAAFRNIYLKEKCDYLDSECKMLAEHVLSSQVVSAEKSENVNFLEKELSDLKILHEQKLLALEAANKKINTLSSVLEKTESTNLHSLNEDKSIDEDLEFKNEIIKCLQEELIEVRLNQAEKWATIRELQESKNELEKDREALIRGKPQNVSYLQEEIMSTNLAVTNYSSEFEKIKKQLANIRTEQQKHKCQKTDGSIKLTLKGAVWKSKNKEEIDKCLLRIKQLEVEKEKLEKTIPELQSKLDVINTHLYFKEEENSKLHGKLNNALIRQQTMEKLILERKNQYVILEESLKEKICEVDNSSSGKSQGIEELLSKLQMLTTKRQRTISKTLESKEQCTIEGLENKILALEKQIEQLNTEISEFHRS